MGKAKLRYAVIDLGSNTFHLLICDLDLVDGSFVEVFRKRSYVYLSKGSIREISEAALRRADNALKLIGALCRAYEVSEVQVFGTATFRRATNIQPVHKSVRDYLSSEILVLSGIVEADYILQGVSWSIKADKVPYLIMDIGGGSVEYIYYEGTSSSRCSINCGISVLRADWKRADPPTSLDLETVNKEINQALVEWDLAQNVQPKLLVGSSGPFEILESMCGKSVLERAEVEACIQQILQSDQVERKSIEGMPVDRADLSTESMSILAHILLEYPSIIRIQVSPYGIKEGFIRARLNLD